jgi:hypothetical protein
MPVLNWLIHLYRLEDEDGVARGDPLGLGDGDLDDGSLHGQSELFPKRDAPGCLRPVPARGEPFGAGACGIGPAGTGRQDRGQGDLEALAVDLDGDGLPSGLPFFRGFGAIGVPAGSPDRRPRRWRDAVRRAG